ncbi:LRR receptor-like serine/threonine-protein kinase FLS2 [Vigna unguiculata]|uniref:LRR receptor-like serine/threonine-protein kinase FLS2 n=1 Tax=Vigna unguiculata TaxID=3917 RepID=A0A4D6NQ14_VIGUN|nr:LRR receptor-like serine/threonine-protein kinase FLS2 [Vigna unguiculata]
MFVSASGNHTDHLALLKFKESISSDPYGVLLSWNFIGTFPSCLYNISSLTVISATANQFTGSLPSNMFHTLPNLQQFYIALNQVSGTIPPSISNASTLSLLEIGANQFTGQVPDLEKLQHLFYLGLSQNNLGDNSTNDLKFLKSLKNCSSLQKLDISDNNFGGQLLHPTQPVVCWRKSDIRRYSYNNGKSDWLDSIGDGI